MKTSHFDAILEQAELASDVTMGAIDVVDLDAVTGGADDFPVGRPTFPVPGTEIGPLGRIGNPTVPPINGGPIAIPGRPGVPGGPGRSNPNDPAAFFDLNFGCGK